MIRKRVYICAVIADIYSFLGNPKGTFGTLLCLQSVVCYTFADGAGVKICCSPYLSNMFSQAAELQRGGRLPCGWQMVRPAVICRVGKRCIRPRRLSSVKQTVLHHDVINNASLLNAPFIISIVRKQTIVNLLFLNK